MGVITCCYKCEKRHKLCHSTCEEYIKQKEALSIVNEKIKKYRDIDDALFFKFRKYFHTSR